MFSSNRTCDVSSLRRNSNNKKIDKNKYKKNKRYSKNNSNATAIKSHENFFLSKIELRAKWHTNKKQQNKLKNTQQF